MSLLSVKDLRVSYGAIRALKGISFELDEGEIIALIGSNGAGKTTTLHAISALIKKEGGRVMFAGDDITRESADRIVQRGLVQVPEGRRIFSNMSVRENLEMGAFSRRDRAGIRADMDRCFEYFPILKERERQIALTLSGGEQQMLAIARALMSRPKCLLMDEPSMGLSPILVDEIFDIIQRINASGVSVLLVEQNAYKALSIANRAYILETGEITKSGKGSDLISDSAVRIAYLGG